MSTAREYLVKYNESHGYEIDEESLKETIADDGIVVWKGQDDRHRWYIIRPTVKDFDGVYILYDDYIITGDDSMSDMDLEYDLDEAKIVERKERTVVEYYYE